MASEDYVEKFVAIGLPIKAELALDTGMRRMGPSADDAENCERVIRAYSDKREIDGIFTHLCVDYTLDQNDFTGKQIDLIE